jgi:hypothetical protein
MIILILLLVHVILRLLLMILIVLIVKLLRDSNDFRLSHFLFPVVLIINILTLFFARVNDFLYSLVFMNVLVNSVIFIIMLLVDLITSLEGLNQIVIFS